MHLVFHSPHARGSALLIVLWVVAFLTFLVTTTMLVLRQDVETTGSQQMVSRARQLAEMGLAVAAHPGVQADDPLLNGKINNLESFHALITSEEARLNLNSFLTEERRSELERIFRAWGLDPVAAVSLVDCLMDWVDEDDLKRLRGAEHQGYIAFFLRDNSRSTLRFRPLHRTGQGLPTHAQQHWRTRPKASARLEASSGRRRKNHRLR